MQMFLALEKDIYYHGLTGTATKEINATIRETN